MTPSKRDRLQRKLDRMVREFWALDPRRHPERINRYQELAATIRRLRALLAEDRWAA